MGHPRRRLLALVPFRDEELYLPGLLENLRGQVDGVIALDDGSSDRSAALMAADPLVIELLPPDESWDGMNDGRVHRRLTMAAWEHGPDWLLGIDADERVEEGFRTRAEAAIEWGGQHGYDGLSVHIREVWDDPELVRVDGLFGRKARPSLFRARRDHVFDDRRLHGHWASLDSACGFPLVDVIVYHLRMLRAVDRQARRLRYERLDPDGRHQPLGYAYMTNTTGIELRPPEPGRGYRPLLRPADLPAQPVRPLGPPPAGPSVGVVLRCHRDPALVAATIERLAGAVDEIVVVADEQMDADVLGMLREAGPSALHRIPHLRPNERGNAYAQSLCSTEWVLRLAGDEIPSAALVAALRALVRDRRFTHYRMPIAWLWPDVEHRLDQRPWWPDHQPRLLRNDPALYHYPGITHGGLDVAGPYRLLEEPILHLDLLVTTEEERLAKVARYESERGGVVSAGQPLNQILYRPEAATPLPVTARLADADIAIVQAALGRHACSPAVKPAPLHLPVADVNAVDAQWNGRPWPDVAYNATITLAQSERDLELFVDGGHVIHLAVENLGTEIWPGALASWPLVRVAYRVRSAAGMLIDPEGLRTPFAGPVRPGERVLVAAAVATPEAGRFVIEFDLVHELVRWFGCALRVPVAVRPRC